MNCQRAHDILVGLANQRPAFTADEIEELLRRGLAIEADPRDLATLQWLVPAVEQYAGCPIEDPLAPANLAARLAEIDKQLKSDWYRFTTGKDRLAAREEERRLVRRALAVVGDPAERARLIQLLADARDHGNPRYAVCEPLGSELYAITRKGTRVADQLAPRLARFADHPLGVFLGQFDKAERKMAAFSGEIAQLSARIGPVRKNPQHVVIGLVKTGAPASEALGLYQRGLHSTGAPDAAVTCARNAAGFGSPEQVAERLHAAQGALIRAGFPPTPVVAGAARTLLPFEPLEQGAARFAAIAGALEAERLTHGEATIKRTARLMPAAGAPVDVVRRAVFAFRYLFNGSDRDTHVASAVALAAMVQSDDDVRPAVQRFVELQRELVHRRVSLPAFAATDALECLACPGTPAEVAGTVRALIAQLTRGREPNRHDVDVAVAFARRFAY